ncbi:MAG: hypothetical protein MUC85_01610 [Anaerolineales bacterium]|nr:hypothetical protein [Anaerolineales bacterium]
MAAANGYAYVAVGQGKGLFVVNMIDPLHPQVVGFLSSPENDASLSLAGNWVLYGASQSGLRIMDVSDPANPIQLGVFDSPGSANRAALYGSLAILADWTGGVRVVDISHPANPLEVGSFITRAADPIDLALAGRYAYVLNNSGVQALQVFDVADPANPVFMAGLDIPGEGLGLDVQDTHLYLAADDAGMLVVDVSDPAHPVLAGSLDTAGRTQEVFVDGHLAYLADGQAGMLVVDILDPAHPVQLGSAAGAGYTWNIAAAGAYAYTVGEVGFQVYDVSDPANPLIAANAPSATLWSRALALGLHTAYVSGWDGILRAIDISNPLSPVQVGTWSMPESITRVSLSGNVAWVAGDTGGLWAVNTADPTNLVEAATYNTAGQVYAMEAGCGMVMAADRSGGLVSFTTSQCAESAPRQALPLELGQASAGMVPLQGYADFRVNVPAGKSLRVKVAPGASADSLELYSRYAALPDWTHYDQVSFTPQADGSYAILISPTQAGDTYLSVYGRVLPAGGSFTILVEEIQYDLVSLTPTSAANSGKISLSLAGLGFEPGMTVELKLGTTVRQASSISLVSPRELWAEVDLLGLAPGTYDVVIRWSGGETRSLLSAFSVTAAEIGSLLEAELVAPEQVRPGRSYTLWLYYRNIGDVEMDAPIFILDGPDGVDMRLYASDPFTTGTLHVLGAGSSGPAGKLSPGESGSIPIFYQVPLDATAHELFNFQLSWMLRDDTEIDWESWESEVRPPDVNPEAWAVTWSHFQQQVGTSWRDFSRVLSEQASYLGQYGGRTIKVDDLFGALLNHAGAASLLAVLDEHRDAYFAARGLPLEFTRQAFSKLDARFSVGPLGRNWSHNYEYHLASPEAGVQSVYGPGGSQRKFYQAVNGTWQAAPGDHGRLEAQANGSFLLTEPDGLRWLFNTAGQLAWLEDANLNRITFTYDGNNRLVEAKHSNGQKLSLSYYTTGASTGRLYRLVDHAGQTTEYIYDASGEHLIQVLAPGSVVTSYTYVPAVGSPSDHALASVTDAGGVNHYFSYDSYGRLASHWLDGEAEREDFTYDSYGSIFVEDALGEVTVLRMNAADLPLHISDAEGRTWQFRYNVQGQPLMQVSPGGGQVRLAYDGMGNFSQYEDPLGGLTLFSYTSDFNRLAMLRDAIGNRLEYHYDENGNLTAQEYPDGSQELYGYDANGNLTANTNRRGQTITFKYNSLGQRTRTSYPDGRTIDYSYNTYGKLLSAADSVSGTITLQWDARGYLTRIDYPGGRWFQYTYDNAGRCTRRTGQDGYIVNYAYDPAGRLRELTDASNARLVLYSYDAKGRLLSEDRGNGTRSVYTYNTAGDLLNLVHYAPGGAEQASFEYTYTADGLRASETSSAGLTSYAYDAAGKLVSVSLPDGSSASYTYDANGNRLRAETDDSLQLHALNTLNQYTLVGDVLFSYDADGNLVSENGSAGITTYTYDAANRLVNVSEPGGDTWEYTYDALGNRSGASHNGAVSTWVFEPSNLTGMDTLPSPAIEYEAGGTLAGRYIYGLGLTARLDGSGQASYYAYNATGHTALLTNSVGTVANSYRYDPFGEETNVVGSLPNPFRYAGRYGVIDRGSSLLDMRARFYLPSLGRFTSADPAATPPWNLYTYANNDPVDQVDPSGLSALVPGGESPDALGLLLGKLKGWFDRANNPNYHVETPVSHCGVRGRGVDASLLDECPSDDSEAITSDDPNEKAGPVGIGVNHIVGRSDTLAYTIYFENVATAAAPAQEVFITDVLDPLLDWSTFQVGEIAFGDQSAVASALGQPGQFYARLTIPDYRPDVTKTWWVDITVKLDNQTGQARWTLRMLDPTTGELPEDVLAGFLPPNDDTGRGQGLVTFTIKPREDAAFSSVITNQAIIIFDQNAPILTNQVINTIGLPHGLMLPLILR